MGCPDSVFNESLLKNHSINCLLSNKAKKPYKDHLCLFRALAMYMNRHNDLDCHTSGYFTGFGFDSKNFRRVSVEPLPVVEEIIQRIIFIYDCEEGDYIGELAISSMKYWKI